MRGRPPAVPASAVLDEVRHLIARAGGEPCPTLDQLAVHTGVNRDVIERALELLREDGGLQVRRSSRVQRGGFKRRMRVLVDGQWSRWTAWTRREVREVACAPSLDHVEAVTAAGRF